MLAGTDLSHVRKRSDQANRSVPTHPEIANVVKEDDAGDTGWVSWIAQEATDNYIGPARFVHHCGAELIMMVAKACQALV